MGLSKARGAPSFGASVLAALVALVAVAPAQETRWTRLGEVNADHFGRSVAWVGDWDGDGAHDFAVGSPIADPAIPPRVIVLSSATGSPLLVVSNGEPGSGFGDRLFALGDIDGDGRTELAVFAPNSIDPTGAKGALASYDSAGHERWTWRPTTATGALFAPASIGDVDGDAIRDLLVRRVEDPAGTTADVDLLSGATGLPIRSHSGPRKDAWGGVVGALGDCDLDGVDDYFLTTVPFRFGIPFEGDLYAFSGATGASLWIAHLSPMSGVVAVDDVNSDGTGDAVVFAPGVEGGGTGYVLSGASGALLHAIGNFDSFFDFVAAGDLDGDGIGDVVGAQSWRPNAELVAYSPATGLEIARRTIGSQQCESLDGGVDYDGDGHVDLLCGLPRDSGPAGRVEVVGLTGWNELRAIDGANLNALGYGSGVALLPDRDGDGAPEIAFAVVADLGGVGSHVQIASSTDGHELARVAVAGGIAPSGLPLIGVPDVDGDHVDDWLFAAADRTVEVRSGRDDSLLRSWTLSLGTPTAVAAAVDAAGHSFAAFVSFQPPNQSEIAVHDLTTAAAPRVVTAGHWNSVACLGDVNGDAALDWVGGDVFPTFGNLIAFSGATGAILWSSGGTTALRVSHVRSVADLSGDGKDDVLVASFHPTTRKVVARSGANGAKLFELADPMAGSGFAAAITPLGDVNHDGSGDFAVGAPDAMQSSGFVDLHSGKTARLLRHIAGTPGSRLGERFAELARGAAMSLKSNGRRQPALVAAAPTFGAVDAGRVDLLALSDLFLELAPPLAAEGETVFAFTRGGKPAALTGLYLVAVDGVAVDQFGAFGFLDSFGEWTTSDVIPTGFSGTEFTLRSYAVGVDGKLSYSTRETLTIR